MQALFGPNTATAQYEDAINVLQTLGYTVVEGGPVIGPFPTSQVWFTEGNEAAAQALIAADPRFGAAAPYPHNSPLRPARRRRGRRWRRSRRGQPSSE